MSDPTINDNSAPLAPLTIPTVPLTATVVKRIGEAVDGYRGGNLIYLVVDTDESRRPLNVFVFEVTDGWASTLEAATADAFQRGPGYIVTGPYEAALDQGVNRVGPINPVMFIAMKQPDCKMNMMTAGLARVNDVASVTVSIALKPGRTPITTPLSATFPGPVEAVFLTLAATDRFVFPRLSALYDPQLASTERDKIVDAIS